jgi:hypothetical protein
VTCSRHRAHQVIRDVTSELIAKCKAMIEAEAKQNGTEEFGVDYMNESDPSILRFLLASREEVSSYVPWSPSLFNQRGPSSSRSGFPLTCVGGVWARAGTWLNAPVCV